MDTIRRMANEGSTPCEIADALLSPSRSRRLDNLILKKIYGHHGCTVEGQAVLALG